MWAELHDLSDAELAEAVRGGQGDAFDVLFRRHYPGACDYAARFAGADHAPDRVAEAFSRVYRALLRGQGPDTNFRAYLYSAVRNAHIDVVRRGRTEVPVGDLGTDIPSSEDVEDDVLSRFDASPIRRAFARLRPAWRKVLWHTAVLGESHEQVARRMGTNPNAVAVLSFRAREGLRQAYLAEHVRASDDGACGRFAAHLPRYVRGQLSAKRERAVDEHVESCRACRVAIADLTQINNNLGAVLTPALLLAVPGMLGGASVKGALAVVLSRMSSAAKGVAGVAVGATAVVVVGVTLTIGSEAEPQRTTAPEPSNHAPPTRHPPPPQTEPPDRPVAQEPSSTAVTPVVMPPPVDVPPEPTRRAVPPSPPSTPPPPPQPPPSSSPPPPSPQPTLSVARTTVVGTDVLRHAWVVFDVTPAAADGVVARISNARMAVVGGRGVTCPPTWPRDGQAVVRCTVRPDHPSTFRLSVHVTFADATAPVSGSVALTGASSVVATDFRVSPEPA